MKIQNLPCLLDYRVQKEHTGILLNQGGEDIVDMCAHYLLHEIIPFLILNKFPRNQFHYITHSIDIKWQTLFWEYEDELE